MLLPTQALLLCDRLRLRILEDADDSVDAEGEEEKALAETELRMSHILVEVGEEEDDEEQKEGLESVGEDADDAASTAHSKGAKGESLAGEAAVAAAFGPAFVNLFRDPRRKCK